MTSVRTVVTATLLLLLFPAAATAQSSSEDDQVPHIPDEADTTAAGASVRVDAGTVTGLLDAQIDHVVGLVTGKARVPAVTLSNAAGAAAAAVDGPLRLNVQVRHRLPAEIHIGHLDKLARRLAVHAATENTVAVAAALARLESAATLHAHALLGTEAELIDAHVADLRAAVVAQDLSATAEIAAALRATLADLSA